MVKKILFICRHNKFRSKIAEAYFNKINKNKNFKVSSAGIIQGTKKIDKAQVEIAKEFGLRFPNKTKPVTIDLLRKQDLIIIVANDIPKIIFNYPFLKNKLIFWKIQDEWYGDKKNIRKIIKKIIFKVDLLYKSLENEFRNSKRI